jgi:succinate dehydrogenase flavin-adding protein (antitoxin of CptAB toxin-antitoxin module)
MRELDKLLVGYLDNHYEDASATDKEAFQALLALPDPELVGYLLNNEVPDPALQRVVATILNRTAT